MPMKLIERSCLLAMCKLQATWYLSGGVTYSRIHLKAELKELFMAL